jgi:hypothetical protein
MSTALAAPANPDPDAQNLQNGILPDCIPSSSDIVEGGTGCGLDDATQLVYNVIKYISYIVIPIATLLLGYAGFTIMTSVGNTEKMNEAKGMLKKVVIGLALIFLSTLIVRYIFVALQVKTEFLPG